MEAHLHSFNKARTVNYQSCPKLTISGVYTSRTSIGLTYENPECF